jgi:hypothetical protein
MLIGIVGLAPAEPSDQRALFYCPKSEGVCFWSKEQGWQKLVDASPEAMVEFERAPDGRVLVLLRGHGHPGETLVVTPDGRVQAIQSNHVEGNLERVAGFDAAGRIVLCSETPEIAHCDVLLPGQASSMRPPYFPENCLFPRILANGSRACLRSFPEPALLLIRGENQVQEFPLPEESNVDSLRVLAPSRFIMQSLNSLFLFEPRSGLAIIAEKDVLWTRVINGRVLFGTYAEHDDKFRCSLQEYEPGLGLTEIWQSNVDIPLNVQEVQGRLLLDVRGGGQRRLILLPSNKSQKEEVLWTEKSAVWQ